MAESKRILVVEDDENINNLIQRILVREGYIVNQAFSGTEGKLLLDMFDFQLILLDLMLPGMAGEEIISKIREEKNMPIIVISAKTSVNDKINVLKLGADDFVSKPFDLSEVLARVQAQLRRYMEFSNKKDKGGLILTYKNMVLNKEEVKVEVNQKDIQLTSKEFHIMELLLSNPKRVFTRANLFEQVWGDEFLGDDNTVNVHISNIRSKINAVDSDEQYIKTVWGIGFKLED